MFYNKFSANTITNPKEHCNNVVIEKEEKYKMEGKRDENEREKKISEEKKGENKERGVLENDLSYPLALSKKEKDIIVFDNLVPKNYFARNLKQDSTLERFRKSKIYIEERNIELEDRYSAIIKKGFTTTKSVYCGGYFRINWRL